MKNLLKLLTLAVLFSCARKEEKSSSNILENLSYAVDTVVIDTGEEILNLSMGIRSLGLSEDLNRLFYFENMPPTLVEVDLHTMKLVRKTAFEQEGPNGIGNFVADIAIGPRNQLYAMGMSAIGLYDINGVKTKDLKIAPSGIDSELAGNYMALYANSLYDFESSRFYCWPDFEISPKNDLLLIDIESESATAYNIPEMDIVRKYSIKAVKNNNYMYSPQRVYLSKHEGKILVSCSAMGNLYEFDTQNDSVKYIVINHRVVQNKLTGEVNNNVDTEAAFRSEMKKVNAQIVYQRMNWDPTRQMFLRLAAKIFIGETRADPSTSEVFLLVYDANFNLLGEQQLKGLDKTPSNYFWKDGKLWSLVNVNDELGFAVLDFKF